MQADKPNTSTRDSSTHTHSQTGNVLFPYWETIIPTAGTNSWLGGWGIAH